MIVTRVVTIHPHVIPDPGVEPMYRCDEHAHSQAPRFPEPQDSIVRPLKLVRVQARTSSTGFTRTIRATRFMTLLSCSAFFRS